MAAGIEPGQIIEAERRVLQALCQATPQGSVRATARAVLAGYPWREPVHQVIFDVLMALPTEIPDVVRSQLPARLTRRGFPDVDIDAFFQPHAMSKQEAERLLRDLSDSGRRQA